MSEFNVVPEMLASLAAVVEENKQLKAQVQFLKDQLQDSKDALWDLKQQLITYKDDKGSGR